ncbi:uncharacterized protein LY79DRAFT_564233 [Colletotrichum navitas]|uniref:Secreted protein n=1 Tax=Colletotrichum navitas TaxID=681940 RepID=A0AAD8PRM9_9PEZI|nr:uncharacterized protein LY79DRAFT_564233 [Colletotrichum navitas]KAK1579468.1 hypothetical protein LY79DRAFT_564233 [Colletotrichum navitas]
MMGLAWAVLQRWWWWWWWWCLFAPSKESANLCSCWRNEHGMPFQDNASRVRRMAKQLRSLAWPLEVRRMS